MSRRTSVSTGEPIRTDRTGLVGLDHLRALARENRVAGARVDRLVPAEEGVWKIVDRMSPSASCRRSEFEGGVPTVVDGGGQRR